MRWPLPIVICILWLNLAPVALADTVYLKNGTRYQGVVLRQSTDAVSLALEEPSGTIVNIPNHSIEVQRPPDPDIATLVGLTFPGAGQLYVGQPLKALFYFALAGIVGSIGYHLGDAHNYEPLSTAIVALIPWSIGAFDARREASIEGREMRFRIEY